jgi:hypothetical protein
LIERLAEVVQTECQVVGKEILSHDLDRGISTRVTTEMVERHEFRGLPRPGTGHQAPRSIEATCPCFNTHDVARPEFVIGTRVRAPFILPTRTCLGSAKTHVAPTFRNRCWT